MALLAAVFLQREFVFSAFQYTMGDLGDGRFCMVIVEHWRRVILGAEHAHSLSFFFPAPGVLAYSECFLLYAIPYIVLRAMGAGMFLAFQWSLFLISMVGFLSAFWLLIRHFDFDPLYASWGAMLFAAPNQLFLSSMHPQLFAVNFVPAIVFLGMEGAARLRSRRVAAGRWLLISCGLLLSALFLTSFYVAWFALFSAMLFIAVVALGNPSAAWRAVRRLWREGVVFAVALGAGLVPFLMLYGPAAGTLGGRPFANVALARPYDVANIGPDNIFWRLVFHINTAHEMQYGWPPVTLALFLASAAYAWWPASAKAHSSAEERWRLILTRTLSLLALLVLGLLVIPNGSAPAWMLAYRLAPGANAIRAPFRGAVVLNGALVLVCLSGVWLMSRRLAGTRFTLLASLLPWIAVFSLLEQANAWPVYRNDRVVEEGLLARVPPPTPGCRSFFVTPWPESVRPSYGSQIDAMLISQRFNLPTLNGYSGWVPPGWDLNPGPGYEQRALDWASRNALTSGLCRLDLPKATWTLAPPVPLQ